MGLFNFVKNAGANLFKPKPAPISKATEKSAVAEPELTQEQKDSAKADQLIGLIKALGLKIDSLFIAVEEDVVTIAGTAATPAEKEKAILAIGNVGGIAVVDGEKLKIANAPATKKKGKEGQESTIEISESTFHTVIKGDSLSKISKQYYGTPMKYLVIFEANQPMLTDVDKIFPGQVLRIPTLEA